jgi:hypothetical protein
MNVAECSVFRLTEMSRIGATPIVMVGEGRPSTSFLAVIGKDVDGEPSPAMTVKVR